MYCIHCGERIEKEAVICVHCGRELRKKGNGCGIASLILGIVGFFYTLCAFTQVFDLNSYLEHQMFSYQFGFAIGFVLIQSILAIVGFCLAFSERQTRKTGFNMAGLCLTLLTLFMIGIQFIVVVTY